MKLTFSPLAKDDLIEIAVFIAHDNAKRALTFVDQLEDKCRALAAAPGIGTARPELGSGVKMLAYGRYLIFYRAVGKGIRIERVMHGARDIGHGDLSGPEH